MTRVVTEGGVRKRAPSRPVLDDAAGTQLLQSALSTPLMALARARQLLAGNLDHAEASYAHQAAAIVLRDGGDSVAALKEVRAALKAAIRSEDRGREADVRATLGITLVTSGRARAGHHRLPAPNRSASRSP